MGRISLAIALATSVTGFISQSQEIPKGESFQQSIQTVHAVASEANESDVIKQALSLLRELRQRRNPQPITPQPLTPP